MTPKGYLLDTNVLSELLRKRPHPKVLRRVHAAPIARLKVSAMSVVELKAGTAERRRPQVTERKSRFRDVGACYKVTASDRRRCRAHVENTARRQGRG